MNKKTLIKIIVSVFLFGFILSQIDRTQLIQNLKLLDVSFIPLIISLLIGNYIVSSIRWKKLLIFENSEKATVTKLTSLYFIGAFFNNFMPTSIGGDVYKIFKLGTIIKSKTNAFIATFMERFSGIVALIIISYYGLLNTLDFWVTLLPTSVSGNSILLTGFKFILFFGFWIGAIVGFISLKLLAKKSIKIAKLYDALLLYKTQYSVLIWAFLTSFLVQFMGIFTQFFIFRALGVDLPLSYALFVLPMITMASFFIPSLNGVGVQDALYIKLFQVVGVPSELALSASILYHLLRLLVSLLGGVFYVFEKDSS